MKKTISIILAIVLSATVLTACSTASRKQEYSLEVIERTPTSYDIFVDKKTGVEYIKFSNCSPIVRIDSEGKPLIYKGE